MNPFSSVVCLIGVIVLLVPPAPLAAQELEPGAYWPIPRGVNIVTAIGGINWGDVAFEPSLPVEDAAATIATSAFAYTRAFGLAGRSANAMAMLPVVGGHLSGLYFGEHTVVDRFGLADPKFKFAMNLYGAPAMIPAEFAKYRPRLIVGASVTVMTPLGQYDPAKLVNLGTNRWSFKPEIGLSRTYGKWMVEGMAGTWLFTDNTNFAGGRTRAQEAIVLLQAHLTYRFTRVMWLAADGNYFRGGTTTIGGKQNIDFQNNSRIGATFSKSLARGHAMRASLSRGAFTTIGARFTSLAVGYNFAWPR
jgi:hypothetical protein